jgi:hypothetical protein
MSLDNDLTSERFVQFLKALLPMLDKPAGKVTDEMAYPSNAPAPMASTENVTLLNVTDSGIDTSDEEKS